MKVRDTYLAFGAPNFSNEEIAAVEKTMRSGWIGMGPETIAFERELAEYLGVEEVVLVNSCTSALFLALLAEGIGPGDEVIVPSLTWCATANAALYLGAKPIFCDIDENTFTITPESVLSKISSKTKAVIPVHFGGYAIDIDGLKKILPSDVLIVEDAAHALSSEYPNGKKVGTSGNLVCFSFYANKNISTADGGAIALNDFDKAERLRNLRMSGLPSNAWGRYINASNISSNALSTLGYKMNYTDLQASIGRVQLRRISELNNRRMEIATLYSNRFSALNIDFQMQKGLMNNSHARHLFSGLFPEELTGMPRNSLLKELRSRNIGASVHYAPLHEMKLYGTGDKNIHLPITSKVGDEILTLPFGSNLSEDDVHYVMDHLENIILRDR